MLRLSSAVCFAILAALVKLASAGGIPFIQLMFLRSFFATLLIAGYIAVLRDPGLLKTQRPNAHLFRSAIGGTGMLFVFMGIVALPLDQATAIGFSAPLIATLLSAVFLKEKVGRHRWLATMIGFLGVLIIIHPDPGTMISQGAIYALVGVCFISATAVTIRQIAATESGVTIAFYFMALSSVALAVALPFFWTTPTSWQWLLLAGIGIAGGLVQLTSTVALRYAPVSTLVPFDYTQLLWAALVAFILWGDVPGEDTLAGAAIVIASGLYIVHRERKLKLPHPPISRITNGG